MAKYLKIISVTLIAVILIGSLILQLQRTTPLPVLMYHHFSDEVLAETCVTPDMFRRQLTALKNAGFSSVTVKQVQNYVKYGIPLPDKPIMITMDDGYTSNITLAAPILEELEMCATVFVIGVYEGAKTYVHTGQPVYPPHFSYEEALPWVEKGVLDLQCHSFDMHQLAEDGFTGRDGMLIMEKEALADYRNAVAGDLSRFRIERSKFVDSTLTALAYPYGYYTHELDGILQEEGIQITFTIDEYCSLIRVWDKNSLRMLGRYNVTEYWNENALVEWIEQEIKN